MKEDANPEMWTNILPFQLKLQQCNYLGIRKSLHIQDFRNSWLESMLQDKKLNWIKSQAPLLTKLIASYLVPLRQSISKTRWNSSISEINSIRAKLSFVSIIFWWNMIAMHYDGKTHDWGVRTHHIFKLKLHINSVNINWVCKVINYSCLCYELIYIQYNISNLRNIYHL